jgi:hypothetical protein
MGRFSDVSALALLCGVPDIFVSADREVWHTICPLIEMSVSGIQMSKKAALMAALQEVIMVKQDTVSEQAILSVAEATTRGLMPLTVAEVCDSTLRVGDGKSSMRYIEWLATEQQRITRDGDRQAEIVDEGEGRLALWVDDVALQ